jgi:hypothetical protein
MLTYAPYETDELLESDEFFEFDESDESDEARRRRGAARAPVRTAKRGGNVPPRPTPGFATRTELTATANRLDAKIATNSTAIKAVEGRVNALGTEQAKLRTDVNKLQGSINDVRNMAMLVPLLTTQSTRTATAATNGIQQGDKVVVDNGDSFSKVLPLLLFSGGFGGGSSPSPGGGGNSGGGMFGGDSGGIMMVALMMAMNDKNK